MVQRYDFCTNQITTKLLLLYKPDEKRPNTSSVTSLDNSSSNYYACHLMEQSLPVSFHVVSAKYLDRIGVKVNMRTLFTTDTPQAVIRIQSHAQEA